MIEITIGSPKTVELRGTYAHPKLIPHIASADFAVKVSDIVNEFFIKGALKEKDLLIEKQNNTIGAQRDKIDDPSDKLDKYMIKLDESKIELQKSNADLLLKKNDCLIKQNDVILEENRNVHKKLMLACNDKVICRSESDDRVKHTGVDADKNLLVVIKNNKRGHYEYTTLCVSVVSKSGRIKNHKNTCIKAKVITTIESVN